MSLHDPTGTQEKHPKKHHKTNSAPTAQTPFVPPTVPNVSGDQPLKKTITWGGRSVEVDYIPGTSGQTVLIVGGVHQDEKKGLSISNALLNDLNTSTTKPYYNVVFIHDLFGDRNTDNRNSNANVSVSRNFPAENESLANAAKRGNGVPKDEQNRKILPENVILLAVIEAVKPKDSLSLHGP